MGDILASSELERGAERVSDRQAQNAPDHTFPQLIHRFGAYRPCPPEELW